MTEQSFLSTLTGCFASPVAENPTVAMIEAAYAHHGIPARYINCDVSPDNLAVAVRGAVAMGWRGFNCSIPHKVAVVPLLDELAESAAVIGAVNCVVIENGRLIGENTDGQGFLTSLRTVADPRGRAIVILGAGGAARAIAVELALAGAAHITIVNRDPRRGAELAALVREKTPAETSFVPWDATLQVPAGTDVLVNATSIGLYPYVTDRPDVDYDTITSAMIVADVIPNPPQTCFLDEARARGAVTLDGLGMLVNQGVLSIGLWTGTEADPAPMRHALEQVFA